MKVTHRGSSEKQPKAIQLTHGMLQNSNLKFIEILSTPWHGAVDQYWRSKLHALKHASQPPDGSMLAQLSLPSWSGKGAP